MSFGWTCSNCTYKHHAPCERCAMCNEMRVTKKQMADFVLGVPIPKTVNAAAPASPAPLQGAPAAIKQGTLDAVFGGASGTVSQINSSTARVVTSSTASAPVAAAATAVSKPKAATITHNPYAKKRPASAMTNHSNQQSTTSSSATVASSVTTMAGAQIDQADASARGATADAGIVASSNGQNIHVNRTALHLDSTDKNLMQLPPSSWATASVSAAASHAVTTRNEAPTVNNAIHSAQSAITTAAVNDNPTPVNTLNTSNGPQQSTLAKYHRPGVSLQGKSATLKTKRPNEAEDKNKISRQYGMVRPPYSPGPVPIDPSTAHDWIYPQNPDYPTRLYQLEMSSTAIFHNTLVSLPTGLGKTLIAAVVMYNYHRWFPTGKVVFMAPTLPLVQQQIKACYQIMGIPTYVTAMLTGKVSQEKRLAIWQERSVFFCTPQTVQKDLEHGTCPAQDVVCVVLDEAHRAAGNYAYVNVVQYLEHSGAKFRVLGLSATPGANIKAIQKVIDVLGINRIEARNESDPSVSQYTHTRTSEIIVVPQVAASKGIEVALNAIIDPLISRLRNAGCFQRFGTNNSISCYNIMKESEAYKERTQDSAMSGFFFAAQKFVQIRDFLHKQGVGMVRTKINELRIGRPNGMVAKIVKGPEFVKLWDEISRAACDPNAHETDARDRLHNNPKLAKLCEILQEHFERARACGKSSRAIVFSQFRDSVSEIVAVLDPHKPTIRSRHFIGQGKGAKVKKDDSNPGQQLQGMNQTEQHNVIREFRNDVYNVLVCTCIGEEGLDIGEVDLIVNFDTLSSPIRSLQRIGRTGRKREGRVVCLVSEGAEEKTMNSSKQKERTLQHALKNPKAFTTLPTVPMFEVEPEQSRVAMNFSQNFRESQVEGIGGANRKDKTIVASFTRWKLTEDENAQRLNILRQYARVQLSVEGTGMTSLRRRLLAGRKLKTVTESMKENYSGRTVAFLCKLEASNDVANEAVSGVTRSRGFRGSNDEALDTLFPLVVDNSRGEWGVEMKRIVPNEQVVDSSTVDAPLEVIPTANYDADATLTVGNSIAHAKPTLPETSVCRPSPSRNVAAIGMELPREQHAASLASQAQFEDFCLPPDCESSSDDDEHLDDDLVSNVPGESDCAEGGGSSNDVLNVHINTNLPNTPPAKAVLDEFRLPTPASSSDESDDESVAFVEMKAIDDVSKDLLMGSDRTILKASTHPSEQSDKSSNAKLQESQTDSSRVYSRSNEAKNNSHLTVNNDSPESEASIRHMVKKSKKNFLVIQDSPEVQIVNPYVTRKRKSLGSLSCDLTNTQDEPMDTQCSSSHPGDADDIICAVCRLGHSPDENPIILCDGERSPGRCCDLAVHVSCYSVRTPLMPDEDWFCDPCLSRNKGLKGSFECVECHVGEHGGALKQGVGSLWRHVKCHGSRDKPQRLKKIRGKKSKKPPTHRKSIQEANRCPLLDLSANAETHESDSTRKRRRQHHLRRFVQEEADCDSDEDIDGDGDEEDAIRAIEEEEALAAGGFINDTSQLDYTQDILDQVDPDAANDDTIHRELDCERARHEEFATPCLGRRFLKDKQQLSSNTPASMPSSEKCLGKMHFIRSVLEHHRQGGDTEDIEQAYNNLETHGTQAAFSQW
ncbi:hypothetical protein MPSEU_000774000 [Mayamaea pseudoterrestris]|nr:hypothetical protein MPSEU_000774000 [Mayamaea pseudoterrestris]